MKQETFNFAARPLDAPAPTGASVVQPYGAAPFFGEISLADARKIVEEHHYSHHLPTSVQVSLGMMNPLGTVLCAAVFRTPPTRWREPLIELGRLVRLPDYTDPLTAFLSKAFKYLAAHNHHLMVSFADSTHDHHGGIYQAASLNYGGQRKPSNDGLIVNGTFIAGRTLNHKYGTRSATKLATILPDAKFEAHFDKGKYLYWKALSRQGQKMADRFGLQKLPYPKPIKACNQSFKTSAPCQLPERMEIDGVQVELRPPPMVRRI